MRHTPRARRIDCVRCGHVLARARAGLDLPLAFAVTALVLLLAALPLPLMELRSFGALRLDALATGPVALWNTGQEPLALVVALFSMLIPFVFLALVVIVLGGLRLGADRGSWKAVSMGHVAASMGDGRGVSGRLLCRLHAPAGDRQHRGGSGGLVSAGCGARAAADAAQPGRARGVGRSAD